MWNRSVEAWTEGRAKEYQYVDAATGRRFMKVPVHAPGVRNGATGKPWRGVAPPPGKHWQFPPDALDAHGEIFWSARGNPRRKVFLDENPGVGVQDIWLDFKDAHNQNIRITGYPTEKNPALLKRIIEAFSGEGDLVLDCFSGSGTTLAVAAALGRRWIGINNSPEAIRTTLLRFAEGTAPMGDFVRDRLAVDAPPPCEQPALFTDLADGTAGDHQAITDFQLCAARASATLTEGELENYRAIFPGFKAAA
jgi:adenine-specific DNA-methyltransferase